MRMSRVRKLKRQAEAAGKAMAIGSLESDRDRDIDDWHAMRRVVFIYMPLMALAPVIASALWFIG